MVRFFDRVSDKEETCGERQRYVDTSIVDKGPSQRRMVKRRKKRKI
jgi:hypothetical protein